MFLKFVIVLLLLIVAASLLGGRGGGTAAAGRRRPPLRPLVLRIAIVLLALGGGVIALHLLSGCSREAGRFHATDVSGANFGRLAALDGLTDHHGIPFASAGLRASPGQPGASGKAVVVFFGYTQCPDICPTALATMRETMQLLGPQADRVQVLFVTVDPERDTQEVLKDYVPWFDSRFLGLRGDAGATLAAAREFHVYYSKVKGNTALDYSIDHSATSYIHDRTGRLRLLVRHAAPPSEIAADLRLLLAEN